MVNTRRKCHGAASPTSKQRPKHWKGKPAGLSTASSLQRLPLRYSTIPGRPLPPPSNYEETWLLLETLNAHQVATKRPINPKDDAENFRRLAISHYIVKLLEDAESTLSLPPSCGPMLEQRVKRIQCHCDMVECPQHERPDLTASEALFQLQHSESLSADYDNWSTDELLDELPLHALFFASRAFGGLCCKLPPDMSREDPCLTLLIPLCDWHDRHLKDIMKNHYTQDIEDLSFAYASIPSKRPGQAGTPRHKPCPPQLAELKSDPPTYESYRL